MVGELGGRGGSLAADFSLATLSTATLIPPCLGPPPPSPCLGPPAPSPRLGTVEPMVTSRCRWLAWLLGLLVATMLLSSAITPSFTEPLLSMEPLRSPGA